MLSEFKPIPGIDYAYDYEAFFREVANKRRRGDHEGVRRDYRWMCRNDLFFLVYFVLRLQFFHTDYHRASWWMDRIREVESGPETNTLDLWFRGAGKSLLRTKAETIQDILRNPEERICVFAYDSKLSKPFLATIRQELETNEMLKSWFPDILYQNPARESPRWTIDRGIIVKRRGSYTEATVEAWGLVDNQPTGRHFTKLVYDDCVKETTVNTPEQIEKTLDGYRLSLNLVSSEYRKRIIGTRYSFADLYGTLIEENDGSLTVIEHPIRVPSLDGYDYNFFTKEEAEEKEREQGEWVFSAQNLLRPISAEKQRFKAEYAKWWSKLPDQWEVMPKYLLADLAGWDKDGKTKSGVSRTEWVVVMVVGEYWYLLEHEINREPPSEIVQRLLRSHAKWGWLWAGIEETEHKHMLDIELEREMRAQNHRFQVKPLKHKGRSKMGDYGRIAGLEPFWSAGRILLHPEMKDLYQQFMQCPFGKHRDGIDALAYAVEYIPRSPGKPINRRRRRPRSTARSKYGGW